MDFLFILRIIAISELILILGILLLAQWNARGIGEAFFLGVTIFAFLFYPLLGDETPLWIKYLFRFMRASAPFWFWMLSYLLFNDNFKPTAWHWLVLPAKIMIAQIADMSMIWGEIIPFHTTIIHMMVPAFFSIVLVFWAMINALRDFANDLLEWRRGVRSQFIIGGGFVLAIIILSRLILRGPELLVAFEYLTTIMTAIAITLFGLTILQIRPDFFVMIPEREKEEYAHDPVIKKRLIDFLEKDKRYRDEELTIRILAGELGVYEYKLRRLINGSMKYRNFNDFLNQYRIQEVCERLLNQPDVPVTRIAMDAGYRSLGTFNRAFKQLTGMSPTVYRESGLNKGSA